VLTLGRPLSLGVCGQTHVVVNPEYGWLRESDPCSWLSGGYLVSQPEVAKVGGRGFESPCPLQKSSKDFMPIRAAPRGGSSYIDAAINDVSML
jgi:hypothetical protein